MHIKSVLDVPLFSKDLWKKIIDPDKEILWASNRYYFSYPSIKTCVFGAQKNRLIYICFGWEIKKIVFLYALLSGSLENPCLIPSIWVSILHDPWVCPIITVSVRYHLVKMFITLEPHGIFLSHFAYICISTFPNHWHAKRPFLIDMGLLSNCPAYCGQLVNILTTLEPYGIFGSNFAYLFILIFSSHPGMQTGGGWFAEHHFDRSRSFSENAHNSWTAWYICPPPFRRSLFEFEEKRWDIVFGIPSVHPSVPHQEVGILCMELLLKFYADCFETLQTFWSLSEDVHVLT